MARKLTLLGGAAAALAALVGLVVPGVASATPELKNATSGAKVAVGSKLMGTNVGAIVLTETKFGTLTCSAASMGLELTKTAGRRSKRKASARRQTHGARARPASASRSS